MVDWYYRVWSLIRIGFILIPNFSKAANDENMPLLYECLYMPSISSSFISSHIIFTFFINGIQAMVFFDLLLLVQFVWLTQLEFWINFFPKRWLVDMYKKKCLIILADLFIRCMETIFPFWIYLSPPFLVSLLKASSSVYFYSTVYCM